MNKYKLTKNGKQLVNIYIKELKAKQKEILDAGIDTCTDTHIPDLKDIENDISSFIDENGDYYNCWGVTDNYSSDYPITLKAGIDFN